MQSSLYLLASLALIAVHATYVGARPSEPPPKQYPHSPTHDSRSGLHLLLPKQLPGRSLPTLHPRENRVWTLNDSWTFFFTTFAQTLPIDEASSIFQGMYSAFQAFSQSRSSSFDGPTRDAVSLSYHGLDLRFEPDQISRIPLPWMHVAAFCKYMYGATQRGFVGKYQGVLMSASGAVIYVSLMDAADRPLPPLNE